MSMLQSQKITRKLLVESAREWLGTPYCHQASLKGAGCDCLGLIRGVWRDTYGVEPEKPPNYTSDWAETLKAETLRDAAMRWMRPVMIDQLQVADVILFRWRGHLPAKHIAIVTGEASFIHACEGVPVCEVAFSPWWRRRLAYAFQFPNLQEEHC